MAQNQLVLFQVKDEVPIHVGQWHIVSPLGASGEVALASVDSLSGEAAQL